MGHRYRTRGRGKAKWMGLDPSVRRLLVRQHPHANHDRYRCADRHAYSYSDKYHLSNVNTHKNANTHENTNTDTYVAARGADLNSLGPGSCSPSLVEISAVANRSP